MIRPSLHKLWTTSRCLHPSFIYSVFTMHEKYSLNLYLIKLLQPHQGKRAAAICHKACKNNGHSKTESDISLMSLLQLIFQIVASPSSNWLPNRKNAMHHEATADFSKSQGGCAIFTSVWPSHYTSRKLFEFIFIKGSIFDRTLQQTQRIRSSLQIQLHHS